MGVTDEIKQKIDIVEVIGESAKLTKAGRTYRALCPFHSEKHPSFYVYPDQQSWHCFGACATGGDVFTFVMKKQGIDFSEALRLLAARAGVVIPERSPQSGAERDALQRLYEANAAAASYYHNLLLNSAAGEKARDYLARRGVGPKATEDFQLGFSPSVWEALKAYLLEKWYSEAELVAAGLLIEADGGKTHDRFRGKLIFPIFDSRGRITGFGARVLDDSLPKYINSPETPLFDKSASLYGINLARSAASKEDRLIIVEGYMDVITAHQSGFANVIASMGTSITEKQVLIIKRLTRNVTLALDADSAGEEAMLRCVGYENLLGAEMLIVRLPEGKDPDDVIREDSAAWRRLAEGAAPILDYTFSMVAAGLDLGTARDKTALVARLLPQISGMRDLVRQAHYLQKLARLVNVPAGTIEQELKILAPPTKPRRARQAEPPKVPQTIFSNRKEEDCLALLIRYPELKEDYRGLIPEHFENTENRVLFTCCQREAEIESLRESLDPVIRERFEAIAGRDIVPGQIAEKFSDYVVQLRKRYLRSLEAKRGEALANEALSGGMGAELARLEEQGTGVSAELGKVFIQERRKGKETKDESRDR